jgi:hypothetical protein
MRIILIASFLFLPFFSFKASPQAFRLKTGASTVFFPDINNRKVFFTGPCIQYTLFMQKGIGITFGYAWYFPTTYYGKVCVVDMDYLYIPAYMKGSAGRFQSDMCIKLYESPSDKILFCADAGANIFTHTALYNEEPFLRIYGPLLYSKTSNMLVNLELGPSVIFRIGDFPFFAELNYAYIIYQMNEIKGYSYSVPFSNYIVLSVGFSFPVLHGPDPRTINKLKY